jgi:uncharacterized protein YehS (DUF1456 family)
VTNNDILRRLRFTFNFNDQKMVDLFQIAGLEVSKSQVVSWLKKDEDAEFVACNDNQLAYFLNGLIIDRRGMQEDRKQETEKRLNNNLILVKLKIALSLKSEDIAELMNDTHLKVTKSELGSFLRKPDHRNYKKCHDQFLRNFLLGIDKKFNVKRPAKYVVDKEAAKVNSGIYQKSASKFSKDKLKVDSNLKTAAGALSGKSKASRKTETAEGQNKIYVNPNSTPASKLKQKAKPKQSGGASVKKENKVTLSRKPKNSAD